MCACPPVSIVIPTYNRANSLRRTLDKCMELTYPDLEIIVVDDCSTDNTREVVQRYPQVKYIRLPQNRGQAYARSVGMATARGKYIASLDDDSWFVDTDSIQKAVSVFQQNDDAGLIACNVLTPNDDNSGETTDVRTYNHIGCGCFARADVLAKIGYYCPFFHGYAEESELSLRLMDTGYSIILASSVRVFHDYVPGARSRTWQRRARMLGMRNDLLTVVMRYPILLVTPALLWKCLKQGIFDLRMGVPEAWFASLVGFVRLLPRAILSRRAVKYSTLREVRQLQKRNGSKR